MAASAPWGNCSICFEDVRQPGALSCGHVFDYKCLKSALKRRKECPLCRTPGPLIKLYIEHDADEASILPTTPSFSSNPSTRPDTVALRKRLDAATRGRADAERQLETFRAHVDQQMATLEEYADRINRYTVQRVRDADKNAKLSADLARALNRKEGLKEELVRYANLEELFEDQRVALDYANEMNDSLQQKLLGKEQSLKELLAELEEQKRINKHYEEKIKAERRAARVKSTPIAPTATPPLNAEKVRCTRQAQLCWPASTSSNHHQSSQRGEDSLFDDDENDETLVVDFEDGSFRVPKDRNGEFYNAPAEFWKPVVPKPSLTPAPLRVTRSSSSGSRPKLHFVQIPSVAMGHRLSIPRGSSRDNGVASSLNASARKRKASESEIDGLDVHGGKARRAVALGPNYSRKSQGASHW